MVPDAPFATPWEARVFAMVVALQDAGVFTWGEWSRALGAAIRPANGPEASADYSHWLATLEGILSERGITTAGLVDALRDSFIRAAEATPHGQPIQLSRDPLPP
jgi:nitrile hydratase accessory protein